VPLTDRDKALLDFERSWWTFESPKDVLIAERFGSTPDEYAGELEELTERPEALAYDPLVVRRIARHRDRRRRDRRPGASPEQGAQ
jgi:hypothetical protein